MTRLLDQHKWAGIEEYELDANNWVQMGFRFDNDESGDPFRVYLVFGEIHSERFEEEFYFNDTKSLAYEFYQKKVDVLDNGCIYCIECGEFATNPEFALAVSQTGGYCLDCAPDPDDETATRWY